MRRATVFLVASAFLILGPGTPTTGDDGTGGTESPSGRGEIILAFTHPAGSYLNNTEVEFRGTVQDTDPVIWVGLSTDGLIWTPASDTGGAVPFSTWNCTLSLSTGEYEVIARANDTSGAETSVSMNITIDLEPPSLEVSSPRDNLLTNQSQLPVSGLTEPGAVVHIGTDLATVGPNGTFNGSARLVSGNNLLLVTARDAAGNTATVLVRVSLDAIPPPLNAHASDTLTNRTSVTVFGDTEQGSSVTVAGREVPVGEFGSFSASVDLSPGLNTIPVSARDRAGNMNYAVVEVVMDGVPPGVWITWPEEDSIVYEPLVGVCGTASDPNGITHVQVGVDDQNYTLAGGNTTWAGTVRLPEGEHIISVMAFDRAGNVNRTERRITYISTAPDIQPPALAITPPQPAVRTKARLSLDGEVSDPSGVETVQFSLNNRTWRNCTLNASRTGWSAVVTLSEGWNTIYVRAQDTKGNTATSTVSVEYRPAAVAPAPDYTPYGLGVVAVALAASLVYIIIWFRKRGSDQPEPGLGEDEAVIAFPGRGLK